LSLRPRVLKRLAFLRGLPQTAETSEKLASWDGAIN